MNKEPGSQLADSIWYNLVTLIKPGGFHHFAPNLSIILHFFTSLCLCPRCKLYKHVAMDGFSSAQGSQGTVSRRSGRRRRQARVLRPTPDHPEMVAVSGRQVQQQRQRELLQASQCCLIKSWKLFASVYIGCYEFIFIFRVSFLYCNSDVTSEIHCNAITMHWSQSKNWIKTIKITKKNNKWKPSQRIGSSINI